MLFASYVTSGFVRLQSKHSKNCVKPKMTPAPQQTVIQLDLFLKSIKC